MREKDKERERGIRERQRQNKRGKENKTGDKKPEGWRKSSTEWKLPRGFHLGSGCLLL